MDRVVERTQLHLDPVAAQSRYLANLIRKGDLASEDKRALGAALTAALAATPQVEALAFIDTDLQQFRVERHDSGSTIQTLDMFDTPGVRELLEEAQSASQPSWGQLAWSHRLRQPLVNLRTPLYQESEFVGALLATVAVAELSSFLAKSSAGDDTNAFVVYAEKFVVAHRLLFEQPPELGFDQPLPTIDDFPDPVLASFWKPDRGIEAAAVLTGGSRGHVVNVSDVRYVFVYRELRGYSDRPWLIGRYFELAELEMEVRRLTRAAWIGFGIFLVAISAAWFAGRAIGKPIQRLALATAAIRNFNLAEAHSLDRSRLREIDQATRAYNSLLAALRWFEIYVPRTLVLRLMEHGEETQTLESRVVTVMFTDIVGFTAFAEGRPAEDVAGFLNDHFELIAKCVEAENGTIDKFIGDSVMAFWGAPERQADHAKRACDACRAIAALIIEENKKRQSRGAAPIGVRIGIHTGPATVGNIGAPGRMNYTVIGDTVNIAQRLEALGGNLMAPEHHVTVLASESTCAALDDAMAVTSIGRYVLKGRREPVEVFRIA